jgi:ketosteroid isomerase-like protein
MKLTDLDVAVGGDVAFSHSIQSGTLTGKDGKKFQMTVRVTDGYKRINGQWLITHEHVSVPVDFATMKPDMSSK